MRTVPLLLCFCTAAAGMNPADSPAGSLTDADKLAASLDRQLAALDNIVMQAEIGRFYIAGGVSHQLDRLEAQVETFRGLDKFGPLMRNGRMEEGASIPGAWSFGEFSTMLRISREALGSEPALTQSTPLVKAFRFSYPAASERWYVEVGSRTYWLAFSGEMEISTVNDEARSITWRSEPLSLNHDSLQIERTVRFERMFVAGEFCNLPREAEYRVVHKGNRVELNVIRLSNAARYHSEATVKFEVN